MPGGLAALGAAKASFVDLLGSLGTDREKVAFLKWIKSDIVDELPPGFGDGEEDPSAQRSTLRKISQYIKTREGVPAEALWPTESLTFPTGPDEDGDLLQQGNTVHVDAFLYDEEEEQQLVEAGKLSRSYCLACGSKRTRDLHYISHSLSRRSIEFVFRALLPPLQPKHQVLDIGSRLGGVLYGAHLFSCAGSIVGLEMNPELCGLQMETAQRFGMTDRVSIVRAEMTTRPDLIGQADVVILNNVFEWFVGGNASVELEMWNFLYLNLKPGAIVVTVPALEKTFRRLQVSMDASSWVRVLNPTRPDLATPSDLEEEEEKEAEIHMYQVIAAKTPDSGHHITGAMP